MKNFYRGWCVFTPRENIHEVLIVVFSSSRYKNYCKIVDKLLLLNNTKYSNSIKSIFIKIKTLHIFFHKKRKKSFDIILRI